MPFRFLGESRRVFFSFLNIEEWASAFTTSVRALLVCSVVVVTRHRLFVSICPRKPIHLLIGLCLCHPKWVRCKVPGANSLPWTWGIWVDHWRWRIHLAPEMPSPESGSKSPWVSSWSCCQCTFRSLALGNLSASLLLQGSMWGYTEQQRGRPWARSSWPVHLCRFMRKNIRCIAI